MSLPSNSSFEANGAAAAQLKRQQTNGKIMVHASTPKELGEALRNNESTIEIEGDLAKKVIRIRATGNVAWAVALVALVGAVGLAIAAIPTGGTTLVAEAALVPAAAAVLGGPATMRL